MARTTSLDSLEDKIVKAQEDVVKSKKKYDMATATLKQLLDKRQMLRTEEVMEAIAKSSRSYEDILQYLSLEQTEEEN